MESCRQRETVTHYDERRKSDSKMAKDFADHMVECVGKTLSKALFEWTMT